jgi:hypothetical protein
MNKTHLIVALLSVLLCACQPPNTVNTPSATPATTPTAENGFSLSAKPNPVGNVVNVELENTEKQPVALVHASRFLNIGWSAVFTVNGQDYTWLSGDDKGDGKRAPLSEDFVVIQPGDTFEFGFPLENFEFQSPEGEVKKLSDQQGAVEGKIVYEINDITRKRWPKPEPTTPPEENPRLVERCEASLSFSLPYGKRGMDGSEETGEGPPPGIGGGPPRPDGGPPTPHPSGSPEL